MMEHLDSGALSPRVDAASGVFALDTLLTPRGLLADADGDGLVDAVLGRLVVGSTARRPEYAAAIDVAARLCLGSLSCALPITLDEAEPLPQGAIPVFVGRPSTLAKGCPPLLARALSGLKPGDGLVASIHGEAPTLLVGGADEVGLAAAARTIAMALRHLPIDAEMDASALAAMVRAALGAHSGGSMILEAAVVRGEGVVEARFHLVRPPDVDARRLIAGALAPLAANVPCVLTLTAAGGPDGQARAPLLRLEGGLPRRAFARAEPSPDREFAAASPSLADLYGPDGLSVDSDGDLLPDLSRVRIDLPGDLTAATGREAINLGARIGLETLGLRAPLAPPARAEGDEADGARPAVIAVEALGGDDGHGRLRPGEGEVRAVSGPGPAQFSVRGGDERGRARALRLLATLDGNPSPDDTPTLREIEERVRRVCALAEPAATAAAALAALDRIPPDALLAGGAPLVIHAPLAGASDPIRAAVVDAAAAWGRAHTPPLPVRFTPDRDDQPVAGEGRRELTWEIDDVWRVLADEVFPALKDLPPDADWELDVRVSEPSGRRRQLWREIRDEIKALGLPASDGRIHVRPAYRQGRAWLLEEIAPRLRELDTRAVIIRCQRFVSAAPSLELPIRWVQELHPVDELLRDLLGLPEGAVRIEMGEAASTYEIEARGAEDQLVWRSTFDAAYGVRPYLSGLPEWGMVHPCTGRVRLLNARESIVDVRVAPDPERAWDVIQGAVLPAVRDHVYRIAGPAPQPDDQPFFGSLTVDVWLSEDDALVGVREERESPLESMHEDIYFVTLDYCSALLGRGAPGGAPYVPPWVRPPAPGEPLRGARMWTAPGSVIPRIHRRDGKGGAVRWRLTAAPAREPTLAWRRGEQEGAIPLEAATRVGVRVAAIGVVASPHATHATPGPEGETRRIVLTVDGPDDETARAYHVLRGWARLREATPPCEDIMPAGWGCALDDGTAMIDLWEASWREDRPVESSVDSPDRPIGNTVVPWDRVLVQEDIDPILARLRRSPRVRVYRAGYSSQGRPSYAIELTVPRTRGFWSRAKLSAWKCTLLLNARHHANEASSTSALLRLAASLAFDPVWQPYLSRVNVVLIPYENPDGAALHGELQAEHPAWMLHAGRYNAHGLEFTSAYNDPLTRHGEARVLPAVWRRWAPDIVSDDHGFPSHEWVQPFAGHSNAWFRSDWIPQGLIYVFLARAINPRYPRHVEAAEALRARMVRALADDPVVRPRNRVYADRYRTFLHRWLPDDFPATYEDDILIHVNDYDPEDAARTRASLAGFAGSFPGVTTATFVTEVADETAQGHYMAVCAHAHLTADRALLQYLYDVAAPGQVRWERNIYTNGDAILRSRRQRPAILPAGLA